MPPAAGGHHAPRTPWTERQVWARARRKPPHGFPSGRVREGIIPSRRVQGSALAAGG